MDKVGIPTFLHSSFRTDSRSLSCKPATDTLLCPSMAYLYLTRTLVRIKSLYLASYNQRSNPSESNQLNSSIKNVRTGLTQKGRLQPNITYCSAFISVKPDKRRNLQSSVDQGICSGAGAVEENRRPRASCGEEGHKVR